MSTETYTAFAHHDRIAHGRLDEVALAARKHLKANANAALFVFSDATGKQMDLDLRGSEKEVLQRLQVYRSPAETMTTPSGPGRPKLGVVAREVSLLPRHWEWLSTQSGGASATIRRLIEDARKDVGGRERIKQAQERTYKFMTSMAGDLPNYEEALRALYAKDKKKFREQIADWPGDLREHVQDLAVPAFETK